jgi:hypothetical protein
MEIYVGKEGCNDYILAACEVLLYNHNGSSFRLLVNHRAVSVVQVEVDAEETYRYSTLFAREVALRCISEVLMKVCRRPNFYILPAIIELYLVECYGCLVCIDYVPEHID